jgi:hypothetical protein
VTVADDGEAAVLMLRAVLAGDTYPPAGVKDTPGNKTAWEAIIADIAALPGGVLPDIPSDWATMPTPVTPPKPK